MENYDSNKTAGYGRKIIFFMVSVMAIGALAIGGYYLAKKGDNVPVASVSLTPTPEPAIDPSLDSDSDTIPDAVERAIRTNPEKMDTDNDSFNDLPEIKNGYSPLIAGAAGKYTTEQWQAIKDKIKAADSSFYESLFGEPTASPSPSPTSTVSLSPSPAANQTSSVEKINKALSVCQEIKNDESKNYCIAIVNSQSSICENKPEGGVRDACFLSFAQQNKDISLCGKTSYNDFCSAVVAKDYKKCESTTNKDNCYKEIAISAKDALGCKQILNKQVADLCFAYATPDVNFCNEFSGANKNNCYINVAKLKSDSTICNTLQGDDKIMCIALANKDKNNLDCTKYPIQCSDLASIMKDDSICQSIPSKGEIFEASVTDCYLNVARQLLY